MPQPDSYFATLDGFEPVKAQPDSYFANLDGFEPVQAAKPAAPSRPSFVSALGHALIPGDLGPMAPETSPPVTAKALGNAFLTNPLFHGAGTALDILDQEAKGITQDIGGILGGNVQGDGSSAFPNLRAAALMRPTPRDIEMQQDKSWVDLPERAVEAVAGTAPRLAVMIALGSGALGAIPAFGLTKEGLDPVQAGIGALFPKATEFGGWLGTKLATKFGIKGLLASRAMEAAGGAVAAQVLFEGPNVPFYFDSTKSTDEKFQKFVEDVAVNLTFQGTHLAQLGITAKQVQDVLKSQGNLKPTFRELLSYVPPQPILTGVGVRSPSEAGFVQNLRQPPSGGDPNLFPPATEPAPVTEPTTPPNADTKSVSTTEVSGGPKAAPLDQTVPVRVSRGPVQVAGKGTEQRLPEPAAVSVPAPVALAPLGQEAPAAEQKPEPLKSSTQLTLKPIDAAPVIQFAAAIPNADIYSKAENGKEQYGRETEPHITALYGLTKHEAGPVAEAVAGHGPVTVTLGKTSVFENENYDVLKVEVKSESLHDLNGKLVKLPNENKFPDYKPHLTIAYLKKGTGAKYAGDTTFEGKKLTFDTLTFSPPEELRAATGRPELPLAPPPVPEAVAGAATSIKTYYASGETSTRGGVRYVSETPALAEQYAEGGTFGRPGATVQAFTADLNIFDGSKASPEEQNRILGKTGLLYIEPDGNINFHAFEADASIAKRLKEAGYDAIRISEGSNGTSIAVLEHAKNKLIPSPPPAPAPGTRSRRTPIQSAELSGKKQEQVPPPSLAEIATSDASSQEKARLIKKAADAAGTTTKDIQENIESEIVRIADTVTRDPSLEPTQKFQSLLKLYEKQPVLSARTSTSVENQAYSTPAPLSYAAGYSIGAHGKSVYDATAGNGMLLIGANKATSRANELNPERYASVAKFLGNATMSDATKYVPSTKHDAILVNPPFGTIPNVNYDGYGITKLEHLISLKALEAMKPDGRAVLILGAKREPGEGGKGAQWVFENYLYGHYNVVDNFEVSGDLYGRQGAKWPVRMIVIDGKRATPVGGELAAKSVDRLNTWDEVWNRAQRIHDELESRRPSVAPGEQPGPPAGLPGNVPQEPGAIPAETIRPARTAGAGGQPGRTPVSEPIAPRAASTGGTSLPAPESVARPEDAKSSVAESSSGGIKTPRVEGGVGRGTEPATGTAAGSAAAGTKPELGIVPKPPPLVKQTEYQVSYQPKSEAEPFGTLSPKGVSSGIQEALTTLEKKVGSVDHFVADRLAMPVEQLRKVMAAEQIDGAALAIDQIESGGAMIIGDETGIGKGRQGAAVIRYAMLTGKIPIFFTKDPKLFTDMAGDLKDIGTDVKPFILGDPGKASIVDASGNILHRAPGKVVQDREMASILEKGLAESGYDSIFVTYSQVNVQNRRQQFLQQLTESNPSIIVLDEAHESAGDASSSMQAAFMSGGTIKRGSGADRYEVRVPGLLNQPGTTQAQGGGVLYMSATYAKRPENMPVYYRSSLSKASESFGQIVDAMKRGGVALQQAVSEALAKAGQYVRRERDFSGVNYDMKRLEVANHDQLIQDVDGVTDVLSEIVRFSHKLAERAKTSGDKSTAMSESAIDMTEFAAVVHNQVGQLLLSAKADAVVKEAFEAHKRGEKPVIALMNTMESFLSQYTEEHGIAPGDHIKLSWGELLKYALSRTLRATMKHPNGDKEIITLNPESYGLGEEYKRILEQADGAPSKFPVSPIDYIVQQLRKAGLKVGELTGRESGINYTDYDTGEGTYVKFKKANKNTLVNDFNAGKLDAMLLNASGSTGLSIHASPKFLERPVKPRHMVIAQPALDINVFVQTLGRIKRTGMIPGGARYTHLVLPLQAELRPAAMAARKMKSLNANTTAGADNAIKIESEDLMNKYGDAVVAEFLDANPQLQDALNIGIETDESGVPKVPNDLARKFTGRMALLPDDVQQKAYDAILPAFRELVQNQKQIGEYDLEVVVHDDWDAIKKGDEELSPGTDENNIFTASVRLQKWEIKDTRHVPTGDEMQRDFTKNIGDASALSRNWDKLDKNVSDAFDKRSREITEAIASAQADSARTAAEQKRTQIELLASRWDRVKSSLQNVVSTAGHVVELENAETGAKYEGMLVSVTMPDVTSVRVAPSQFKFRFMVNDPSGSVHISGSQLTPEKWTVSRSYTDVSDLKAPESRDRRSERYVIAGNPIRGYQATGGRGKMVRFKDSDGNVVTGLLMPSKWEPENLAHDPRYDLASVAAAVRFLRNTQESIRAGNMVQISRTRGWNDTMLIQVPSAKSTGGPIYLDTALRKVTGDFYKRGSRMTVEVSPEELPAALKRISEIVKERFRPSRMTDQIKPQVEDANKGGTSRSLLPSMTLGDRVRASYNYQTGEALVSASVPEAEHAALVWHEIVGHGGIEAEARKQTESGAQMRRAIEAAADSVLAEADAIAQKGGYRDAEHLRQTYGFDTATPEGRQRYLVELIGRFGEKLANEPRPSWWRDLLGRIQVWFAKRFGVRLSLNGVEALLRAAQRDVAGKKLRVVADLNSAGEVDVSYSRAPIELGKLEPDMRPEDRKKEFAYKAMANHLPTRHVEAAFNALPASVKALLPGVRDAFKNVKDTGAVLGGLPQGQTLREMAVSISPDPADQARAIMETSNVIFDAREARDLMSSEVAQKQAVLDRVEARDVKRDQPQELAADMLNEHRQLLAAQRAMAEKTGDAIGEATATAQIKDLDDLESALSLILKATSKGMGPMLADPKLTKTDVVNWMTANAASLPKGFQEQAVQLAAQQTGIVDRLRVIAGLKASPEVEQAQADLAKHQQADAFLNGWVGSPQNRALEAEARDIVGFSEHLERLHKETGEDWFQNPHHMGSKDPATYRTIEPDIDQAAWERNNAKFNTIREWLNDYLADESVNDAVRKAGVEQQLRRLDMMQNQSISPALGKIAPGRFNLFGTMSRVKPTTDYVAEIIGGRLAYMVNSLASTIASMRDRIQNLVQVGLAPMQIVVKKAAQEAGFKGTDNQIVEEWNKRVGERILEKGQARGDVKKQIGDKVLGHVITAADMRAVKAQKSFMDQFFEAVQSVMQDEGATVGGETFLVRTLDKIGNKLVQRRAQDVTGQTMPQRPDRVDAFTQEWKKGETNKEDLVNRSEFWPKVLSHIRGYTSPEYKASNPTPFGREYRAIEADTNETGHVPQNLDALAQEVFAKAAEHGTELQDIDSIKAQILSEIGSDVNRWEKDWVNGSKIAGDDKTVSVISAENFLNRPRGERIMPPSFYTYTITSEESIGGLKRAIEEIYTHELLRTAKQLEAALADKETNLGETLGNKIATISKKQFEDGKSLVHYRELRRLRPMLAKIIADWEGQATTKSKLTDQQLYSTSRTMVGHVVSSLLGAPKALWRNFIGGPQNTAMLDLDTSADIGMLRRIPVIHPLYAGSKAVYQQSMETMKVVTAMLSGTAKGRQLASFIRSNLWLPEFIGNVQMAIDRKLARYEEMKRQGLVSENPMFGDVRRNVEFMAQMGRITRDFETPSMVRKAIRAGGSVVDITLDTGLLLGVPPRALGAKAVDNFINAGADVVLRDMLATIHMNSNDALNVRKTLNLDPFNSILTPEEVFGLNGHSNAAQGRSLAATRSLFAKAGISFDRYLIEHWQSVQEAKEAATTPVDVMTTAQRNSLLFQIASRINKSGPHNRPLWTTPEANLAAQLLGYGMWQNGRMAVSLARWSRDGRKVQLDSTIRAANLIALVGIVGTIFGFQVVKRLGKLFYNEESSVKNLTDTTSVGDFAVTALRQSYANLPLIGQTLNYMLGEVRPGSSMSAGGFNLLVLSMATSIADAFGRTAQTGDVLQPTLNLLRQWVPNTRVWINRLGVREGLANESAMRAIVAANVPDTMEVKPYSASGTRKYSAISSEVEKIRNALSRSGGPDMGTATQARAEAVAKLQAAGHSAADAAKMVDAAVLASDPFRTITGRDPTATERAQILGQLNESQRAAVASVEGGRQAYAQAFGKPVPDFTTTRGPVVEAEAKRLGLPSPAAERASASSSGGSGSGSSRASGGTRISRGRTMRVAVPRTSRSGGLSLSRGTVTAVRSPRQARVGRIKLASSRGRSVSSRGQSPRSRRTGRTLKHA